MAIIYTGQTALDYWRWQARTGLPANRPRRVRLARIPEETPNATTAILESDHFRIHQPIELLTASYNSRCSSLAHRKGTIKCKVRSCDYPLKSFCRLSKDVYVVSPELLFLEMSKKLTETELLRLGYELISSYTPNKTDMRGFSECVPLTTERAIIKLIGVMGRYGGIARARHVSRYLIPNSASPMETNLSMLLTLPRKVGGFGLPKPLLNHEVPVDPGLCSGYIRSSIRFDLLWASARCALEYDSNQWHSGVEKLTMDSMRRNAIRAMGYDVTTVTSKEYKNIRCMTDIARTIAKKIGYRLNAPSISETVKRSALMDELSKS